MSLERIELTLRAEPESLAQMRRALGRWLRAAGATDAETYEALVACGEACANAIAHAYPPGEASYVVEGRRDDGGVEVRVRDFGTLAAAALGLPGPGPRADRGADGRGRDRPRPGRDDRPHAPRGRRRRRRDRPDARPDRRASSSSSATRCWSPPCEGEIDSSNAAELRLALSERLPSASSALVLDLSAVTYLDSSGIHLLFDLGRRLAARRQALRLVVPDGAPMRRVLELCAVDAVAPMDRELDASLQALAETEL